MLDNKGFNLWADGYDKSVGISDAGNTYPFAGYKEVLNKIYNEVLQKANAKILDIGFGTGTLTTKLYQQGCDVSGVDFSERMMELAREKMPKAKLMQGDFSKGLPEALKGQTYDAIIGTYSLHHLTDEEKVTFLEELCLLLNDGGKIFVGDVAFDNRKELEICRAESGDAWDGDEIYFVYDELKKRMSCEMHFEKMSHCAGVLTFGK